MDGASIGERRPVVRDMSGRLLEPRLQVGKIGSIFQLLFRLDMDGGGFFMGFDHPRTGFGQGSPPRRELTGRSFRLNQRIVRRVERVLRFAPGLTCLLLGLDGGAQASFRFGKGLLGRAHDTRGGNRLGVEFSQPVLLRQALRGRRRCVRARRETIPAPQCPFTAHQPLAGHQQRLQTLALTGFNDTDLRKATCKLPGRLDDTGQTANPLRQGRVATLHIAIAPVHGCATVQRHIEIFAKRRAKCCLETAFDTDLFQHGRKEVPTANRIQDLGQRARFGLDACKFRLGLLQRSA